MRKVNISLVGGQPMPVYMGIKATQPDLLILVHSKNTGEDAKIIKENSKLPASLYELPPVDYPSILLKAEILLNQLEGDEVFINVSSGTKPWSIAFSLLAEGRENVTVFYIDQTTHFHDLTHKTVSVVEPPKSIDTVLRYHNQHGFHHRALSSYSESDWQEHWKIRKLRQANRKDFRNLTSLIKEDFKNRLQEASCRNDSLPLNSGSWLSYDKDTHEVEMEIIGKYKSKHDVISSPMALEMTFFSGWFELEVAKMFEGWHYANDIWMNVFFPSSNNKAKNEIDIIVDLGNRLLFVECKTYISNITDIDKFRTAVNNFGGTGSMALFVSESKLTPEAQEKCEESNVLTFSLEEAVNPREPMSLQQRWGKHRTQLLSFLGNYVNVINKK